MSHDTMTWATGKSGRRPVFTGASRPRLDVKHVFYEPLAPRQRTVAFFFANEWTLFGGGEYLGLKEFKTPNETKKEQKRPSLTG